MNGRERHAVRRPPKGLALDRRMFATNRHDGENGDHLIAVVGAE
ncbi:hypothetical protein DND132_2955 [Pseudodesulfovibrio mercurii]|uniref:Uncharacterized protein n=1 Tax=Pseudodesulfovibrio mercurii TaxID=641491 RepID=F0JJQ9_9BACT|nr:hypothetical protein DND132_2955 [Pseudodesulfovibrio mercurii]